MSVKIARITHQEKLYWARVHDDGLEPLNTACASTADLVADIDTVNQTADSGQRLSWDEVTLQSTVTADRQFICQGANYRQHMIESGVDPDAKHFNMIFTKATSCLCAADSPVIKPNNVHFLDYEIELGLILRRAITPEDTVTEANLHEYSAGITIVNDYSARDIQIPQMQFYKGKSFRTFGPAGPWIQFLDADSISYLKKLDLTLTVNGEVRQQDSTSNMVYGPVETLNELASVQDLHPGDLIATGTPAGCALSIPSPGKRRIAGLLSEATKWKMFFKAQAKRTQYLQAGQVVEASIRSADGVIDLGRQRNEVIAG